MQHLRQIFAQSNSPHFLPELFDGRRVYYVLTVVACPGMRIASLYHLHKELPPTFRGTVFARWHVKYPCRLSTGLSSAHALPCRGIVTPCTSGTDVFVNQITVSFSNVDTIAMIPFFTSPIASYHPCVIVTLSANTEYFAIIIGPRSARIITGI